jgi:hypothetical protein
MLIERVLRQVTNSGENKNDGRGSARTFSENQRKK